MENKINNSMVAIWGGFTILLAVTLTVNAIQSIFGQAVFAYWHLFTLAVSCIMTRASMTEMQWLRMLVQGRRLLRCIVKVGRQFRRAIPSIFKALKDMPAQFLVSYHNHIQTEP